MKIQCMTPGCYRIYLYSPGNFCTCKLQAQRDSAKSGEKIQNTGLNSVTQPS